MCNAQNRGQYTRFCCALLPCMHCLNFTAHMPIECLDLASWCEAYQHAADGLHACSCS